MSSRSNSYSASTRSATITRKAEYTFTLSSSYTGISATKGSANATATVTQAKNVITSISLTVSGGALTAPGTYNASAHT